MRAQDLKERVVYFEKLQTQLDLAKEKNQHFGLVLIDILNYREVTSSSGLRAGAKLIGQVKDILLPMTHQSDCVIQTSETALSLFLPGILNENHLLMAAHKLQRLLHSFDQMVEMRSRPKCSIGLSLYPNHGLAPQSLLQKSELALIDAIKEKKLFSIYSHQLEVSHTRDRQLENDLLMAIENNDFEVYYQPKVKFSNSTSLEVEALIRWKHPDRGFIPPERFITLAEQIGHISRITEIVLKVVFQDLERLKSVGIKTVSINLSVIDLRNSDILDAIKNSMSIWGVSPEDLVFEVTESVVMEDEFNCLENLNKLRELGVGIAIDDFGTGYSSLQYFKSIPATELKIDRYFISNMLTDNADLHIIELIISLARSFGMKVVAEGVEEEATFNRLKTLGCDVAQGYFFAKPLPLEKVLDWITRFNSAGSKKA
ncbi:MAG: EAL domain-containing protein [Kangiellaceae bacterium]|nr:EAL domain-containing protein [Kangiellaceae bacterium]